jgi:hypothetical protein
VSIGGILVRRTIMARMERTPKTHTKKTTSTTRGAKKTASTKTVAKKTAKKKTATQRPGVKKAVARKPAPRADYGAPIDGFFAKQPPQLREVLLELRTMVEKAAPDAQSSLKWGMPVFTIGGVMMCALGGHKSHVNLILAGPPGTYADPDGRLTGEGKTGRHLKLTGLDDLPRASVKAWLAVAAKHARKGA